MSPGATGGPVLHDATIACLPLVSPESRPADAATLARHLHPGFQRLEVLNPFSFSILAAQGVNPWDWLRAARRAAPDALVSVALSDLRCFGTEALSPIAVADVVFVMEKEGVDLFRVYVEDGSSQRTAPLLDAPGSGAQVAPVFLGTGASGLPPPGLEAWVSFLGSQRERSWIALTPADRKEGYPPLLAGAAIEFWGWSSQSGSWLDHLASSPSVLSAASVVAERLLAPDPEVLAMHGVRVTEPQVNALRDASLALRRLLRVRRTGESGDVGGAKGEARHLPGLARAGPPVFAWVPTGTSKVGGRHPAELGLMEDASLSVQMLPEHSTRMLAVPPPWAGRGERPRKVATDRLAARRPAPSDGAEWVTSPMPGRVLEVKIAAGQPVTAGDPLLTLEAMKMQNHITAPRPGTIASVEVRAGDRVRAGQKLVRLARLESGSTPKPEADEDR